MSDRLIVSEIHVDEDISIGIGDPISTLLAQVDDAEYRVMSVRAVTNTYPGEAKPSATYFVRRVRVEHRGEQIDLTCCTCPSFKYGELPRPEDVNSGEKSLHGIGRCKHGKKRDRTSRSTAELAPEQDELDEFAADESDEQSDK